ncbi:hypothetical protein LTR24_010036 [Lithohypha guttulata]|uniref:Uncharacterized protein n=1 Tax=Lithohypha guttulata TaxID=1690604 RepID=A0ABR0JV86_9EURO|nr:hypothetical protein LTR24_010036 [Lithohypha guttulata]
MTAWDMLVRNSCSDRNQTSTANSALRNETHVATHDIDGQDDISSSNARMETHAEKRVRPTPAPEDNTADVARTVDDSPLLGVEVNVPSNLSGAQAQARILQKMEAAGTGVPDIDCCCMDLFKGEKDFKRWRPLYQMLLDENESVQSLHHARALARLCCRSVLSEAMKSKLESTLEYYTDLLARSRVRNNAAYAIALRLAGIQDGLAGSKDNTSLHLANEFFDLDADIYLSASKSLRDKYSHLYQDLRHLSILDLKASDEPSEWVDNRDEHRKRLDAQLLEGQRAEKIYAMFRGCREVVLELRNLIDVSQYASSLKPWLYHKGHTHARSHFERTNTIMLAQRISDLLRSNVQRIARHVSWCHSSALVSLVFDAIGLIVAQEFHERGQLCGLANDDIPNRLTAATSVLEVDVTSTDKGNTEVNINHKLLQAIWMCDRSQPLFAPQGLHIGPCKAKQCWELLGQSVTQFDQTTSLVAPTALPRKLEPHTSDDVSMLSSSTKSSFQKFRRLSDRLRRTSSTITAATALSKWSGHMSVDSTTPEKVLGVGADALGPTLPVEEHRRLDEEAFRSMRGIVV